MICARSKAQPPRSPSRGRDTRHISSGLWVANGRHEDERGIEHKKAQTRKSRSHSPRYGLHGTSFGLRNRLLPLPAAAGAAPGAAHSADRRDQAGPGVSERLIRASRHRGICSGTQFAVVDAGRTVRIYQRSSFLMPVGWSLMRPGLRNEALIVYNCR